MEKVRGPELGVTGDESVSNDIERFTLKRQGPGCGTWKALTAAFKIDRTRDAPHAGFIHYAMIHRIET